jgi:hypothetical protein
VTYPAFQQGGSGRGGNGQNYDYATSTNIFGPYTYHGSFTRTLPTQKHAGNIHGSQFQYGSKWYCLYHDFSLSEGRDHNGFKRCVDLDEMTFNPDGSIQPLVWTKTGPPALKNLNPFVQCNAVCMNDCDAPERPHAIATQPCSTGGMDVGGINNGAWIKYANVDFGRGPAGFRAKVASPLDGGKIELHLDTMDGPLIGVCNVPNTGGWQIWKTATCAVSKPRGVHALFFKFFGPGTAGLFNIDTYQFSMQRPQGAKG